MNRRQLFKLGAATLAAPAIVRATSLMPIYVPPKLILWEDGIHDDWEAAQAVIYSGIVYDRNGKLVTSLSNRDLHVSSGIYLPLGIDIMDAKISYLGADKSYPLLMLDGLSEQIVFDVSPSSCWLL